jgi:hypothetical protein
MILGMTTPLELPIVLTATCRGAQVKTLDLGLLFIAITTLLLKPKEVNQIK